MAALRDTPPMTTWLILYLLAGFTFMLGIRLNYRKEPMILLEWLVGIMAWPVYALIHGIAFLVEMKL